jgi:hypothetical protein
MITWAALYFALFLVGVPFLAYILLGILGLTMWWFWCLKIVFTPFVWILKMCFRPLRKRWKYFRSRPIVIDGELIDIARRKHDK